MEVHRAGEPMELLRTVRQEQIDQALGMIEKTVQEVIDAEQVAPFIERLRKVVPGTIVVFRPDD